jgi:regulator of RNase E activity RraB
MLRAAVGKAVHDMDTMFIIAATTHEALELMAEEAGIEFRTGFEVTEEEREQEYAINNMKARKILSKHAKTGDLKDVSVDDLGGQEEPSEGMDAMVVAEEVDMPPEPPVRKPTGLMSRGE